VTNHHRTRTDLFALGAALLVVTVAISLATRASANTGSVRGAGQSVQIVRITDHAFSWGDAGIGAAAGIGISMLAVGATLIVIDVRRDRTPRVRLTTKEQP
jgi:hypothetical protein